ncbi:hypothetical protein JXA05_04550 [Candidatus Peregrinibacteria bacterium]|nr:hypothetical protein [Candidatus Peregrinibacteria bacterium]
MLRNLFHHHESENGFGLWPARALNKVSKAEKPPEPIAEPASEVNRAELEWKKQYESREIVVKKLNALIAEYNKKFDTETDKSKWVKSPWLEPLQALDADHYLETVRQIDRILCTPFYVENQPEGQKWLSWFDVNATNVRAKQRDTLLKIRGGITLNPDLKLFDKENPYGKKLMEEWNTWAETADKIADADLPLDTDNETDRKTKLGTLLTKMQTAMAGVDTASVKYWHLLNVMNRLKLQVTEWPRVMAASSALILPKEKDTYEKAQEDYLKKAEARARAHGNRLVRHERLVRESVSEKTEWEKNEVYKDIITAMDGAYGDPEYKTLWTAADGSISQQKWRESKELLLAILGEKTDKFKDPMGLFGPEFQNDETKNRKRFPFFYNEWIKYKGISSETLDVKNKEIEAITAEMQGANVRDVAKIVEDTTRSGIKNLSANLPERTPRDYAAKAERLKEMQRQYTKKAAENDTDKEAYEQAAKELGYHIRLAEAKRLLADYSKAGTEADQSFTRANLMKAENRQIVVEMAMKQFVKAMQTVDTPFGQGDWHRTMHPAVRRALLATIYETGVGEMRRQANGEMKYVEDLRPESYWMLGKLAQSLFFNRRLDGKNLDDTRRTVIAVAQLGNYAAIGLEYVTNNKKAIELAKADKTGNKAKIEALVVPGLAKNILSWNDTKLTAELTAITEKETVYQKFLAEAENCINDPYSDRAKAFLAEIRKEDAGEYKLAVGEANKNYFKNSDLFLQSLEVSYNSLDYQEKSKVEYFDRMGINVRGAYLAYMREIAKDPSVNVDNWDDMFLSPDPKQFSKLADLMERVLGDSDSEGKRGFMAVFRTLHKRGTLETTPETRDYEATAIEMFKALQVEIKHRAAVEAASARGETEVMAKLEGMTFADKISQYAKKVIDMAIGSGQSVANRAAGIVLLFGAYKIAMRAIKGKGKMDQALRLLLVGGAVELAAKKVTGQGILEKYFKLDSLSGAMEGTYEAVLLDHGREIMGEKGKEVTDEQHAAALFELNKVPFSVAMEWYMATDENGEKLPNHPDHWRKMRIDTGSIAKGLSWQQKDEDKEGRRIVRRVMENFFRYVGAKDKKYGEEGHKILKERYVDLVKDPNAPTRYAENFHRDLAESFRGRPSELTWKLVMHAEIDPLDVERVQKSGRVQSAIDAARGIGETIDRWTRQEVLQPGTAKMRLFWERVQVRYGPQAREFLADMGQWTSEKLRDTGDYVEWWWQGHKAELRKLADESLSLTWQGITIPFKVFYAGGKWAIPFASSKLRALEAMAGEGADIIDHELGENDMMPVNDLSKLKTPENAVGFERFGLYQVPFAKAFTEEDKYYESDPDEVAEDGPSHVGYYISAVGENDPTNIPNAEVQPTDSPDVKLFKLQARAYEKAKRVFAAKGLGTADIKKFMDTIHIIQEAGEPMKIHVFYRMPLKESPELQLKRQGKWPDYMDAARHKYRPPFITDPSKGFLDNVKTAFLYQVPLVRDAWKYSATVVAQATRLVTGTVGGTLDVVRKVLRIAKVPDKDTQWIVDLVTMSEERRIEVDEIAGTPALGHNLALSKKYKNAVTAKNYKDALEFAVDKNMKLYLKGSTHYSELPAGYTEPQWQKEFQEWKNINKR